MAVLYIQYPKCQHGLMFLKLNCGFYSHVLNKKSWLLLCKWTSQGPYKSYNIYTKITVSTCLSSKSLFARFMKLHV